MLDLNPLGFLHPQLVQRSKIIPGDSCLHFNCPRAPKMLFSREQGGRMSPAHNEKVEQSRDVSSHDHSMIVHMASSCCFGSF